MDRGARLGKSIVSALGEELRRGRVAAGLPQAGVCTALGMSESKYSRIERGKSPSVSVYDLARALAVVGLELSARVYPKGSPLRDGGHLGALERFGSSVGSPLVWATEVALPGYGDLRSWDGFIRGDGVRIGVECEMRPTDWQELDRRISRKRRDGGVDHVVLLLPNTRSNRAFVRNHAMTLRATYPVDGREALRALREGRNPGGSAVMTRS